MGNLIQPLQFYDNGSDKREKENFQGFFFNSTDMRDRNIPISFYRSDFRGAKFEKMNFKGNNFSNSDFIDSSIISSSFEECQFRFTEIYNTYFESTVFTNNNFSSASFIKILFYKCNFSNSKFVADTFRECKLKECTFSNCKFEKNSIDEIEFEKVTISNTDLSNMTAINLFFDDCNFDNVIIDADYLGSYFFKGNFFENLMMKYRGKVIAVEINKLDILSSLFNIYFERERYYEALNIAIQKNHLENKQTSIYPLVAKILKNLINEVNQLKKSYQVSKIFKILEYYVNTKYILANDYFKIIAFLESLEIWQFDFMEKINFSEKVNRLKIILEKIDFNESFIENIDPNDKMIIEIAIDEDKQEDFENYFDKLMLIISKRLGFEDTCYKIINIRKGSIIYDILTYSTAALLFLRIFKLFIKGLRETINESIQLKIDYHLNSKILYHSKKIKGPKSLREIKNVREIQSLSKNSFQEITTNDFENAKGLIPLIKSATIYPNGLSDPKS